MIPCILGVVAFLALASAGTVSLVSACADVCRLAAPRIAEEQASTADTEVFPAAVTIPLPAIPA